ELATTDLRALPAGGRERHARDLAGSEAARPFDLARGPLVRARLLRLDEEEALVVLTVHHIVADDWSLGVLVRETAALYSAAVAGIAAELPELPIQYADFAVWQRRWLTGEVLAEQIAFWKRQLHGAPFSLPLPADHAFPPAQTFAGASRSLRLAPELSSALSDLSRREGATLFMTLLAGLAALLERFTGQSDLVIGTPIANRNRTEIEGLIGFFVNLLALRLDLGRGLEGPEGRELLAQARERTVGAYSHQDLPLEKLVDELRLERDPSRPPLFQVLLVLQNAPARPIELPGLTLGPVPAGEPAARFELTFVAVEAAEGLAISLDYNRDLFEGSTAARLLGHFATLLGGLAANPRAPVSALPLLAPEERQQLLVDFNDTRAEEPLEAVHEMFARRAAEAPDALAVLSDDGERLTYGELERKANRLARRLRDLGAGPEARIGVCLERSPEAVVAIFGILKAGAAYVPLDTAGPRERLAAVIEDSGLRLVLTLERHPPALPLGATGARALLLDAESESLERQSAEAPAVVLEPEHPAYVIYTSGSTGRPKGVIGVHRSLANFVEALAGRIGLARGDRLLLFAPLTFDASALQIFPTLASGAALVLHREPTRLSSEEIVQLCARREVTVLDLPAALWRQWVDDLADGGPGLPSRLRAFLTGGEKISAERLRRWAGFAPRDALFLSSYGPTEATVTATWLTLTAGEVGPGTSEVPLGRPLANVRVYLLDARREPVPAGVPGQIYIGGRGLTRGYLGRPEATAEAFVPDPFSERPGERLYRTGDLARRRPDGHLEFLGRADHQVKIRGFRVELAEIEAMLARHPAVREAAVTLREDRPGDRRLVAYAVAGEGRQLPAPGELRSFLAERLPPYMVPSSFVPLPSLPLLASGKVDRSALPAPAIEPSEAGQEPMAPRSAREEILAGIWARVLGIERVGIHDNFFELGGDSILSLQIVARAARAGLRINPRQLFERQTVAALAEVAETAAVSGEQGPVTGPAPLLPIQRWFFAEGFAEPHHFNQALALAAREPLDDAALARAVAAVHAHHDALRLRFLREPEGWSQAHAVETEPAFTCVDLAALPAARQAAARAQAAAQVQEGFDLARGPLARLVHFSPGTGAGRLVWAIHHLVVDGVSWRVLLEDLETAYAQAARGLAPALPPKTTSYKTWAERLSSHARSGALASELEHWATVARTAAPRLPVDFPAGLAANRVGTEEAVSEELSQEETQALLQKVPALYRTQVNDALLAALAQAFAPWTGSGVLRVDLEGHGREELFPDVDLSRTVGWFTTQFPVVVDVTGAAGPGAALAAVKEQLRAVPGHGLGYGLLRYLAPPESPAARGPATVAGSEISFNYLGQLNAQAGEPPVFAVAGDPIGRLRSPGSHRTHLLEVTGLVAEGHLQLTLRFSPRVHLRSTVEPLAAAFAQALRDLASSRETPRQPMPAVSDFPMARLNDKSLHKLLAQLGEADSLGASSR
ncbi:MAG TPA: amino acid adenylation domain-containing protein, partial [Thermoanaerobaculia bacterium]|nr:amino acid adenylation domain-containing protein [Thermoanaerobaculia bacterium]